MTTNYYEKEYYPIRLVREFARDLHTLTEASVPCSEDIEADEVLSVLMSELIGEEPLNIFYRFNDDEPQTPALGFRYVKPDHRHNEQMVNLVYCDPSLDGLWKHEFNRIR